MVSNHLATAFVKLKVTYNLYLQILLLISSIHKIGNLKLFLQGAVMKILTTRKGLIGFVNVKTRVYEPLFASESDPIAMTYDIQRNFIYWADKDGNIYKALNRKSMILYSGQLSATSMQNCLNMLAYTKTICIFISPLIRAVWFAQSSHRLAYWTTVLDECYPESHLHRCS